MDCSISLNVLASVSCSDVEAAGVESLGVDLTGGGPGGIGLELSSGGICIRSRETTGELTPPWACSGADEMSGCDCIPPRGTPGFPGFWARRWGAVVCCLSDGNYLSLSMQGTGTGAGVRDAEDGLVAAFFFFRSLG